LSAGWESLTGFLLQKHQNHNSKNVVKHSHIRVEILARSVDCMLKKSESLVMAGAQTIYGLEKIL